MGSSAPDIRLVAIDLDGTLLNDSKRVSDQTALALRDLPRRGVKVVIASARPPRSVRAIYQLLALDTWQVNYNGALIWDEPGKKAMFHRPLAGKVVRAIIEFARNQCPEVLIHCELLDRWYTDRTDNTYTTETGRMFKPDVVAPLETFFDVPMTKLLILGKSEQMTELEPSIGMAFEEGARVVRTDAELIQIMHRDVTKVAAHYGVPMGNVMAIGDAPNDVGMLQSAGVAVAMDNAHFLVKNVAHWIAPSNNDHGVHTALVQYGLA
jgi:Cof subfamily protein (haloacid dehalogenase superfamily)